jgi:hypothetical protein
VDQRPRTAKGLTKELTAWRYGALNLTAGRENGEVYGVLTEGMNRRHDDDVRPAAVGMNFRERNTVRGALEWGKLNPIVGVSSGVKGVPFYMSLAVGRQWRGGEAVGRWGGFLTPPFLKILRGKVRWDDVNSFGEVKRRQRRFTSGPWETKGRRGTATRGAVAQTEGSDDVGDQRRKKKGEWAELGRRGRVGLQVGGPVKRKGKEKRW